MKDNRHLSKESRRFLEDLRLYLFSSGKNSEEIEGIVRELEDHLSEAEQNGKPIKKIIGNSPKEYMKMVSNEMAPDYRTWLKYICLIIIGSFSFKIIPDLLSGSLSYSVLEITGYLFTSLLFIMAVLIGFKYNATIRQSGKMQGLVLAGISLFPLLLFIGLIFLNRVVSTPMISFGSGASYFIGVIMVLFIIGFSIWAKSWALIIVLALLTLPDYLLDLTSLSYDTQLISSMFITFGGIAIYLWVANKSAKPSAS